MITQVHLVAFLLGCITGLLLTYAYFRVRQKSVEKASQELLSQVNLQLGALSAEALRKNSEQFFMMAQDKLGSQLELGEQDLDTKKQLIDETLKAMKAELDGVQTLVNGLEKDRELKFGELTEQLRQAAEQTGKLQDTTEKLRIALSNTRTRGQWGERMADDVLRAAGFIEGVNYLKQQSMQDAGTRPDFTFLLPQGLKINMDVKFPLDNYLKYLEAESEDSRKICCDRYLQDVRNRIKEVTKRDYINPEDGTINYVIVFIPNEQLFAFVSQQDPRILDDALKSNVIMCSPLTLFAILAIIRQAFDNFHLEQRTMQVLTAFGAFHKQWNAFIEGFDRLGKRIDDVKSEYITLTTRRRNQLDRQLAKIDTLRQNQDEIPELSEGSGFVERDDLPNHEIKYTISGRE